MTYSEFECLDPTPVGLHTQMKIEKSTSFVINVTNFIPIASKSVPFDAQFISTSK